MTTDARALRDAKPGISPANRSLERGIDILRAFRPGSEMLANGDLAERTGLARSTVSRLTQTLAAAGMLQLDPGERAWRLAPAVLSLAHAMRSGSRVLAIAAPKMRALADRERINVGLAAADRDEMVYLESMRTDRRGAWRNVVSGQRVPIELTSLGRCHLATVPDARRKALLAVFRQRRGAQWPALARDIDAALRSVREQGWCAAAWQPEVVAVAAPLRVAQGLYAVNVSVSTAEPLTHVAQRLSPALLRLVRDIEQAIAVQDGG